MTMTREQFIAKVGPMATTVMLESKVNASLIIAQACLESGYGKSAPGNMLFGVKATKTWTGLTQLLWTTEYINGTAHRLQAKFRAYASWLDSLRDHSKVLLLPRYKAVVGERDAIKAARAVAKAGYATDPLYADKLINIINKYNLARFDKETVTKQEEPEMRKDHGRILIAEFLRPAYKNAKTDSYRTHVLNLANAVRVASGEKEEKTV